jgi:hypothetical protein
MSSSDAKSDASDASDALTPTQESSEEQVSDAISYVDS